MYTKVSNELLLLSSGPKQSKETPVAVTFYVSIMLHFPEALNLQQISAENFFNSQTILRVFALFRRQDLLTEF